MQGNNFGETYGFFRDWYEAFYKQFKAIPGFNKKFMVCETACVHDNQIVSATVTGTQVGAYTGPATTTVTSSTVGGDAILTIVGTNPVTSVTVTDRGGYFYESLAPITLNNGAVITPIVSASTVGYSVGKNKVDYIKDLYDSIDLFPDLVYLSYFAETRYFPYSIEEKKAFYIGKETASYNQLKDWFTFANWSRSGTNQGAAVTNQADYPETIFNPSNLQSIRLTHNGTAGVTNTNRYTIALTQAQYEADRTYTVLFWAKSSVANFNLDISMQATTSFDTTSSPQAILTTANEWQLFKVRLSNRQSGTSIPPMNLRFSIGQNNQSANIDIFGLGVFYNGQFTTQDLVGFE
jgi:hypothetical protein